MDRNRGKRRRRRRWMGYLAFLVLVLTAAGILCLAMFFRTKEITVSGNDRYTPEELISASGIQLEQNIFTVDRGRTAAQIKGAFSYLEEVRIVPVMPTTVEIQVVESVPQLMVVNSAESYSLLSTGGRVIEQCAGLAGEELPLVLGTSLGWCSQGTYPRTLPPEVTNRRHKEHREATDQELEGVRVMQTLEYITASAERAGMELDYIDVSDDLCTSVLWNKHVLIQLGTELELDRKMAFAKAILEEELGADFIGTIDVSVLPKNSRAYTREAKPEEFIHPFYLEHYYKY